MLEDFRLKIFITVAKTGSFTRSSKLLNISQPAVSQNIAELEKNLNTQLFYREKGVISLTDEGQAFKKYAEKILYWYNAADNVFGEDAKLIGAQSLRINASDAVAAYILPEVLGRIKAANPELNIILSASGEADIEFSIQISTDDEIIGYPIDSCLISSPYNKQSFEHLDDLADLPKNSLAIWSSYKSLLSIDLLSRVSVKSTSIEFIKRLVAQSSEIVALVPEFSVLSELKSRELIKVLSVRDVSLSLLLKASEEYKQTRLFSLVKQCLEDSWDF